MKNHKKQSGYALLILMALLTLAAAALAAKTMSSNSGNSQFARDKITAAALAQAKEALIGYAITYAESHPGNVDGYLPCPDTSGVALGGEGAAEGNCGAQDVSVIGRLPWKTLDLPALRGGDSECLWYAVSGTYKNNPKTGLMNWDTNGQLQVYASDGITLLTSTDNQAVAVIFAPGVALGQSRPVASGTSSCGGNYIASNYLDNDTVHGINNSDISTGKFIQPHKDRDINGNIILTVNDQLVFITKQDIWNAMQKRSDFLSTLTNMTQQVALCVAGFGFNNNTTSNKSLPWPAQLPLNDYSANTNYNDSDGLSVGRVPYKVNTARGQNGNSIPYPYYLLQADGSNCPVPGNWTSIYPWWNNWKDQLFYAVSQEYQPDNHPTNNCGTCVTVNKNTPGNAASKYAAVVIFANQALSGQNRASSLTDTQRGNVTKYLEGSNATNIASPHSNGNEDYQISATSTTFNDIIYCIKQDLSVVKGDVTQTPACP